MDFEFTEAQARAYFPDLRTITRIKAGGQKVTFRATFNKQKGEYALKIISPDCTPKRIDREIKAMKRISSPYIVRLWKYGQIITKEHGHLYYYIEDFVDGLDLEEILKKRKYTNMQYLQFVKPILLAIEELYSKDLVHRDIKPSNIIIQRRSSPKLVDLGLVRHILLESITTSGRVPGPGTLKYSSPEQIMNRSDLIDTRSDLFSLGIVSYEMTTGAHPFCERGDTKDDVMSKICDYNPIAPHKVKTSIDSRISDFIMRLLEKVIHRRWRKASFALKKISTIKLLKDK